MSKEQSNQDYTETGYENLSKLIHRAEEPDDEWTTENPFKYEDLFNDEEFLKGILLEVYDKPKDSNVDIYLTANKTVLPYVHYDIYEFKKSYLNEVERKGWDEFLTSIGYSRPSSVFEDMSFIHKTKAFELIFEKKKADSFLSVYNTEGYRDLVGIKKALKEELIFNNKVIYSSVVATLSNISKLSLLTKIQTLKKIFRWLYGRPQNYSKYRFMYEFDSKLLGIADSVAPFVDIGWLKDIGKISRSDGAKLHFKYKLLDYLVRKRKHGKRIDNIGAFYEHYQEQTKRLTDQRGNHNKKDKIMLEEKAFEVAREWEDPLTPNGNPKTALIDAITEAKHEVDGEMRNLHGYKLKDKNKNNPQELTPTTVRNRLNEEKEKWLS